ncbi:hypothetical protein IG631_01402 [Alternaria alternata]|nr:hypothetical protein IG631_01402 [Alternaria alternata]
MVPHAIPMDFLYISSSMDSAHVTPDMYVRPTHTYATAPRDLDILLLGGPNPATVKEESLSFLQEASKQTKVILTTCTGAMWLARSGVLEGKKATTNRVMLHVASKMFPGTEWVDRRWVVDAGCFDGAEIWTAGGAGCGESSQNVNLTQLVLTTMWVLTCSSSTRTRTSIRRWSSLDMSDWTSITRGTPSFTRESCLT